ncbi:hypothetical protein C5167_013058 [Papaver somniferum]|uniref:Uncharacterized protein n=1 Tax=Papaver somniferum TaxID=3469 RepID=A0A4Y7J183_PAPSO|nr:nodulation-signaling pathway 2 protein-like [Papaver somniferum]RZC54206.1 hypothetical protein C5167_013058 [Papaver somniferum]
MAMAMEVDFSDFDFSGHSTTSTTTTTEDDVTCNWNDSSPVIDWDVFSGDTDGFRGLIESMMSDPDELDIDHMVRGDHHEYSSDSLYFGEPTEIIQNHDSVTTSNTSSDDSNGLRLVHLLMAAAEALTGANKSRELVKVILVRLKELVSPTNGTNMERLAAYFTEALQSLLEGAGHVHSKQHHGGTHHSISGTQNLNPTDVLAAFQLLQDMSPYVKFGHFTANQAILEAVKHDRRVHIIDYDIMEGIQWASLMQALVSRKDGPPTPHLRITALARGNTGRKSIGTVQETGRRLLAFAASIGLPFSFHQCRLDPDESFRPSNLKLVKGEALIINCMLHFPHFSCRAPNSVASFLSGAKSLNPKLVTLVEEEMGGSDEYGGGFVGRFMDSLHHYSAVFDSLEAGFPLQNRARALVEKVFLGPRIAGRLAGIYRTEQDGEECCWGDWIVGAGFSGVGISFFNHCQSKLLLGLFNDGYRVEELHNNKIVLGWKSRRLISASLWSYHQTSPLTSDSDVSC